MPASTPVPAPADASPPPMPHRAFGLDLVRAIAVSSVLVAHGSLLFVEAAPAARHLVVVFGVLGVEVFFALSGFLVGRQLLRVGEGEVTARAFLLRRWYRTLPNYYLFLAVNAAIATWIVGGSPPRASYLGFAQSLAWPAAGTFFQESWSLAIEEWFYGLAALAFALAARMRLRPGTVGVALLVAVLAGPLVRYGAQLAYPIAVDAGVRKITLLRLDALAFGLGCAWIERYRPGWFASLCGIAPRAASAALALACAAWLLAVSNDLGFFQPARMPAGQWLAACVFGAAPLATALWLPWLAAWQRSDSPSAPWVAHLSEWSYATYLTHFPTLLVLLAVWKADVDSWGELTARAVVWLAVALGLAALVYRYFERPLTDLRPPLASRSEGSGKRRSAE